MVRSFFYSRKSTHVCLNVHGFDANVLIRENGDLMATCYKCGQPISPNDFKLRRKVKTGESVHRRYPNPNVSSTRISYGIRLVCAPCARKIDWEARRKEFLQYGELLAAVLLVLGVLIFQFLNSHFGL